MSLDGPLWQRLGRVDSRSTPTTTTLAAAAMAVLTGGAVFVIATTLFPYHSANHDEGVYLLQAAMLLEGQVELTAGALADAVRPWFFVQDGGRLYPRYAPVPAAMYAVSMAVFDEPRVTLAVIGAANAWLVYRLGSIVYGRRVGLVATVLFAGSPLALFTTSVFLPYAPSTFLHLVFAVAYLRSLRDDSHLAAGIAGIAIGVASFARPFTAVLVAAPFVLHALWQVGTAVRAAGLRPVPRQVSRHGLTASIGLAFVGLTLAYNARLTGSPLTFPFEAFAPLDSPGFGHRRILSHSMEYTPALALEANGYVLWYFASRWFVAGPVGTALAIVGLGIAVSRWGSADHDAGDDQGLPGTGGLLLGGMAGSVVVGNLAFWGNRNILAVMSDPSNGIISLFGPFYHFDLLVPLAVFGGLGGVVGGRRLIQWARPEGRIDGSTRRRLGGIIVVIVVAAMLVGSLQAAVLGAPLERHGAHTEKLDRVYQPVETTRLSNALVFVPTPFGDWLHHPFQYLRNQPSLDGPVVYAMNRHPDENFRVLDAYPDRSHYRFTYRGTWTADPQRHVDPKLEPITVHRGALLRSETTVGVPAGVETARIRLENDTGDHVSRTISGPADPVSVNWSVTADGARLGGAPSSPAVDIADSERVVLTVTLAQADGSTLTYRQEVSVRVEDDRVAVVWPPERTVCRLVTDCGRTGTYLPGDPEAHLVGVSFETRLRTGEARPVDRARSADINREVQPA